MGAAALRSFRDLSLDRRHLYPVHRAAEGELSRRRAARRGVVRRDRRRGVEACAPGTIRSFGRGTLSRVGLERRDAYDAVVKAVPPLALGFVVAGGVLYSLGVIFHAWQRLRFHNAIWHGFVLLGAACHYTAILDMMILT